MDALLTMAIWLSSSTLNEKLFVAAAGVQLQGVLWTESCSRWFVATAQLLQATSTAPERKLQPASPQAKQTAHSKQAGWEQALQSEVFLGLLEGKWCIKQREN